MIIDTGPNHSIEFLRIYRQLDEQKVRAWEIEALIIMLQSILYANHKEFLKLSRKKSKK